MYVRLRSARRQRARHCPLTGACAGFALAFLERPDPFTYHVAGRLDLRLQVWIPLYTEPRTSSYRKPDGTRRNHLHPLRNVRVCAGDEPPALLACGVTLGWIVPAILPQCSLLRCDRGRNGKRNGKDSLHGSTLRSSANVRPARSTRRSALGQHLCLRGAHPSSSSRRMPPAAPYRRGVFNGCTLLCPSPPTG
jgi:hypothetical protein